MAADQQRAETRFRFGENWQSFVATVTPASIAAAERDLARLLPDGLAGRRFLDIGCGSGLSMLAALRQGAGEAHGVDRDPQSVAAARALLERHAPGGAWTVREASVFDLAPGRDGAWDVVHSWGVLHHTGDLWRALGVAAALVAPGGRLAVALYRRTAFCRAWTVEKRLYAGAPRTLQALVRGVYKTGFAAGLAATGRSLSAYRAAYAARGMDWSHDVHDWLGGYPYQSTDPDEVAAALAGLGFAMERVFAHRPAAGGLFGTHCDEFVARRHG